MKCARISGLLTLLILAAACGEAAETGEQATTPAADTATAAGTGAEQLPADDADVQSIEATLTEWSVTLSQDSVPAGVIAFDVRNTGTATHRFEVEGGGEEWESEDIAPGDGVTMSLSLSAGEYKVYCPIVAGGVSHEERGMVTTLRVY